MKRTIRFMLRYVLLPLMILAAIPTVMLIQDGYELYAQALEECPVQEMAERIESKPDYTPVDELPQIYLDAVISVEDHRFYSHPGVDLLAIGRAAFNDLRTLSFAEGGSTITQQLAKNLYFSQEKQLTRKIAEVFVALDLEKSYSKDEIFELYVNSIYFGDGYYGIGSASLGYFELEPSKMNDYESTLLAGVPNAPSRYAPSKYLDRAEKRQLQVLRRMEACGYYSREEAETVAETAALAFAN